MKNQRTNVNEQPVGLGPVQPGERILILDVLRGFALLGVLAVNITGFVAPSFWPGYTEPTSLPWWDDLAAKFIHFFAEAKFYTIFAFLFGIGFSVQLERAQAKNGDIRSFYPRRLGILLGFGFLHCVFFWTGDILRLYALLGFALLAFRKRSNRTLLLWAGVFFLLSFAMLWFFNEPSGGDSVGIPGLDLVGMARRVYLSSSYLDVIFFQLVSSIGVFFFLLFTQGPSVMALFLLGLLAGRLRMINRIIEDRPLAHRILLVSALIGLAGNSAMVFADTGWLISMGQTIGAPAFAVTYMTGLSLLSGSRLGSRIHFPLSQVGRMALTNYVMQSLICSVIFYGFGLGLFERIGAALLLVFTAVIYFLQILFSIAWLKRFQYGPLEWVWRSLTYRKRQPFVRQALVEQKIADQMTNAQ